MGLISLLFRKKEPKVKGPFELSVDELCEKALAPPGSEGGRKVLLAVDQDKFRFIPKCMHETAKRYLDETGDVEKVLRYIVNGFYIYRATVCSNWQAVFYKVEDAYEWPAPAKFSWSSIDAVILGGEYVHGPIPDDGKARITVEENGKIKETTIELKEEGAVKQTTIRDIIPGKDNLKSTLKYKIDDLSKVGFEQMQNWQTKCLRNFVHTMYNMVVCLAEKKSTPDEIKPDLEEFLQNLVKPRPGYFGVYSKKPRNGDLVF
jgi:hypothetical protein